MKNLKARGADAVGIILVLLVLAGGTLLATDYINVRGDLAASQANGQSLYEQLLAEDIVPDAEKPAEAIDGKNGQTGPMGPEGKPGADGEKGLDGIPGAPGAGGTAGANGFDGKSGANGVDGGPGSPGASGVNGADGAAGSNGLNGADGAPGPQGPPGVDGAPGADGANGLPPLSLIFTMPDGSIVTCTSVDPFDPAAPAYICS